jgi:hypothetical protein
MKLTSHFEGEEVLAALEAIMRIDGVMVVETVYRLGVLVDKRCQ